MSEQDDRKPQHAEPIVFLSAEQIDALSDDDLDVVARAGLLLADEEGTSAPMSDLWPGEDDPEFQAIAALAFLSMGLGDREAWKDAVDDLRAYLGLRHEADRHAQTAEGDGDGSPTAS